MNPPAGTASRICPECKARTPERVCPTCHITTVDEAALSGQDLVGRVFVERYEVVELVGRGGMGAVYKARHVAMDSWVALKVLRREASGDLDSIERFYREARAASRLQHPNTIRVFDFGQSEDGQLFLAMEYLEGLTLRAEVRRVGRMDPARVLRIAEQLARSLGEAHEKGIVHRDVKPENVFLMNMLGHPDFVKILDFGVARTLSSESLTRTGLAIGTPAYMSPEQARGEKVDGRSDLYSLGVMMFEMTAGIPPFESSTPMHLMLRHISEAPPRLTDVCGGGIPPDYEALVHQLLAKAADDRPHDASALLDRIAVLRTTVPTPRETQATQSLGTEAPAPARHGSTPFPGGSQPSPTPTAPMRASAPIPDLGPAPAGRRRSPNRFRWIAASLALAGVAALAGGLLWPGKSPTPTRAPAQSIAAPSDAPKEAPVGASSVARPLAQPEPSAPGSAPPILAAPEPAPSAIPPSPAAATAAARARLSGTPDGAKVVRLPDGAPLGRLPLDIEVSRGAPMHVRISAPGFKPADLTLSYEEVLTAPERPVKLTRKAQDGGDGWDL